MPETAGNRELEKKAQQSSISTNLFHSSCTSEYIHATSKECISAGDKHLANKSIGNAIKSYREAFAIARQKRKLENMVQAWGRLSRAFCSLVENGATTLGRRIIYWNGNLYVGHTV